MEKLYTITNEAEGTEAYVFMTTVASHPFGAALLDTDSGNVVSVTRCKTEALARAKVDALMTKGRMISVAV